MGAILKENTANYISLESLINEISEKHMNCQFFNSTKENCKSEAKMTMRHSGKQMN